MVKNGEHPARPIEQAGFSKAQDVPDTLWDLIERCWGNDPGSRPTMEVIVEELSHIF